ncbi:MAG: hypothetical protein SFV22_09095, partial [Saprospiraceae bacterium]|nr:hypothetical protein [Saprospiraceae bacterium]
MEELEPNEEILAKVGGYAQNSQLLKYYTSRREVLCIAQKINPLKINRLLSWRSLKSHEDSITVAAFARSGTVTARTNAFFLRQRDKDMIPFTLLGEGVISKKTPSPGGVGQALRISSPITDTKSVEGETMRITGKR